MHEPEDPVLKQLVKKLSPDAWEARVACASKRLPLFQRVRELIQEGKTARQAIRDVFPGEPIESRYEQYLRFREKGLDGLIDHRYKARQEALNEEMKGFIRGLVEGNPKVRSPQIREKIATRYGCTIGGSTIRNFLREGGLAAPVGRPSRSGSRMRITPLPCAGAELLKAVEQEIGAVRTLTRDIEEALGKLPPPNGEVHDDSANRDELGRFLSAYNDPEPRRNPDLGEKFESVDFHRESKDLPSMRTAKSSTDALFQKNMAMTLLPLLVSSARWDGLANWKGEYLKELCGFAYQPATLDKYMRELKYANIAEAARESVARLWISEEGSVVDPARGAVVVYADTTTKPHWTRHFSKSTPIAKLGNRVMPGASSVMLNSGFGTPLIYRTLYGQASLPDEVLDLLKMYERIAGEDTAKRMVIMDREADTVGLFKALDPKWLFVIPLKDSVTGSSARFEEVGPWEPYRETDEVRSAMLWLNDSKDVDVPIRVRAVARRRGRTGKVMWFATNTKADGFPASSLMDTYFSRWPLQEHVFRDANGAVHLNMMYGFGKKKVENVAVIDRMEKIEGQIRNAETRMAAAEERRRVAKAEFDDAKGCIKDIKKSLTKQRARVRKAMTTTAPDPKNAEAFISLLESEKLLAKSHQAAQRAQARMEREAEVVEARKESIEEKGAELMTLRQRSEVYTVDTTLDETMLAFKLTFLNLCSTLLRRYFGGLAIDTTTLIDHILTLPGERVTTPTLETIRIYYQAREKRFMGVVEEACRQLTEKKLKSGRRMLCFEIFKTNV
jgi:transposase